VVSALVEGKLAALYLPDDWRGDEDYAVPAKKYAGAEHSALYSTDALSDSFARPAVQSHSPFDG
jgi:hypothetical protein